jgi:hypothetical protein
LCPPFGRGGDRATDPEIDRGDGEGVRARIASDVEDAVIGRGGDLPVMSSYRAWVFATACHDLCSVSVCYRVKPTLKNQ